MRTGIRTLIAIFMLGLASSWSADCTQEACLNPGSSDLAAALSFEDGIVYMQVANRVSTSSELQGFEEQESSSYYGWTEVWQEGHWLLLNTTDNHVSFELKGADTYIWASVFDGMARFVFSSSICHTQALAFPRCPRNFPHTFLD
jgi:hypothetical protein